jgi:hypothetical protein
MKKIIIITVFAMVLTSCYTQRGGHDESTCFGTVCTVKDKKTGKKKVAKSSVLLTFIMLFGRGER